MAGIAALLVPSALIRNDLKQYTADAFSTLVVLWLISRLESDWSRRRLLQLAGVVAVSFLFSAAAIVVGTAAFGSLLVTQMIQRQWRRSAETAMVGTMCGTVLVGTYIVVYRPGAPPGLYQYWASYYPPLSQGWGATWDFLLKAQQRMVGSLGLGPPIVVLVLLAAGIGTLLQLRRTACALMVPFLLAVMVTLAAARQYPLFDVRTSHFLTVALVVTAAIGVAGLCPLASRLHPGLAAALAGVLVVAFVIGPAVRTQIRAHTIADEDLKTRQPTSPPMHNRRTPWSWP